MRALLPLLLLFLPGIGICGDAEGERNDPTLSERAVSTVLADLMEEAVRRTGYSINIFRLTDTSADINRVNGQPVGPDNEAARQLQDAIATLPGLRANFGPFRSEVTMNGVIAHWPDAAATHIDFIHVSVWE